LNLAWVASLLEKSAYLDMRYTNEFEEDQLRARIHCHLGLTRLDVGLVSQKRSRAYVYDMRNYRPDNHYGPFMIVETDDDNDLLLPEIRVNWLHVHAIHHVMSSPMVQHRLLDLPMPCVRASTPVEDDNLSKDSLFILKRTQWKKDEDCLDDFVFIPYPTSLHYCQSVIPEGIDLDNVLDWAGVEGLWSYVIGYVDEDSLLRFNAFCTSEMNPRDTSTLENDYFREIFHTATIDLRITRSEPDPSSHPSRPRLHFVGNDLMDKSFVGWVCCTSDDQIRWHLEYGYNNHLTWSSSGVQVGGVRSSFGVLGGWTTINHGPLAPVGPFWLHKLSDAVRDEDRIGRVIIAE